MNYMLDKYPDDKKDDAKPKIVSGSLKNWISNILNRRKTINSDTPNALYEIIKEIETSSNLMTSREQYLLGNFLKFHYKTVSDVMTPRSDIKAIKFPVNLKELTKMLISNLYTRTPVYENNLDNIMGFIHIKDLFKVVVENQKLNLSKILRKPLVAAPSTKLMDLLALMQKERTHLALVVDEYGGTDGMITVEDIVQEILGSLQDEYSNPELEQQFTYKIINDKQIMVSARLEIDVLEEIIGKKLKSEDDEFETIGGLVLSRVGHVPPKGFIVELTSDIKAEIIDATPRILKTIKLTMSTPGTFTLA